MKELLKTKAFYSYSNEIIFSFLLFSFVFDFISKIEIFYTFGVFKFNRALKIIFLAYSILFIILHFKILYNKLKGLFFVIFLLSIIFLLKNNHSELYINEYARYIFPLFIFPLLYYTYITQSNSLLFNLYNLFKWLVIINAFLICISLLFEIKIFKTYNSSRFGFSGIILSQGVLPYVYLAATTLFWVFKDKKMLFLLVFSCLLSGVKGVYFAEFLFFSLLILSNQELTRNFKIKAIVILFICFIGVIMGLFLTPLFRNIIKSDGLLAAIFSFRIEYFFDLLKEINSNNFNILIGAIKLNKIRVELQIIDIILFFGIIGFIAYSIFLYLLNKSLAKYNVSKIFFLSVLITSVLSGNLLYVPLSFIMMLLVLFALSEKEKI